MARILQGLIFLITISTSYTPAAELDKSSNTISLFFPDQQDGVPDSFETLEGRKENVQYIKFSTHGSFSEANIRNGAFINEYLFIDIPVSIEGDRTPYRILMAMGTPFLSLTAKAVDSILLTSMADVEMTVSIPRFDIFAHDKSPENKSHTAPVQTRLEVSKRRPTWLSSLNPLESYVPDDFNFTLNTPFSFAIYQSDPSSVKVLYQGDVHEVSCFSPAPPPALSRFTNQLGSALGGTYEFLKNLWSSF